MPNYSGIWTITQQMQTAGGPALWPGVASPGEQIYTGGGTYTWVCPVGVFSVSVVCVGGGGGGDVSSTNPGNNNAVRGAGGGGLGWKNNIPVTPGNSYTVQVGGTGSTSFFISSATVAGFGGQNSLSGGAGGSFTGDGGGTGGAGGTGVNPVSPSVGNLIQFGGGGGAGGYSGPGGAGGNASNGAGSAGSGGGGGGGGAWTNGGYSVTTGYGSSSGGGVGLYGLGSNGTAGAGATGTGNDQPPTPGGGGSGGNNGGAAGAQMGGNPYGPNGGSYGGGASPGGTYGGNGGSGAVRIIWEGQASTLPRSFPNNAPVYSLYAGVLAPETTYTLTSAASVDEGSSVTFTAGGSNITDGTYYWTVTASGEFGTSSGAFTIIGNRGTFRVTPIADVTAEGIETFTASIRSGSTSGTVLRTSNPVTINDSILLHTLDNPNAYGTSAEDQFGRAVAIGGNYAIVGVYLEDDAGGSASGKAYIFNATTGALLYTLNNPNAYAPTSVDDGFGHAVAIGGNYAIVGAYSEEDDAGQNSAGRAYIFNVTTGALVQTLNNPNGAGSEPAGSANDWFGYSVAVSGNYAVVGAPGVDDAGGSASGKTYIFNPITGALVHTLNNPNAYGTSASDRFGYSVAISGDYAIVGAYDEDDAGGSNSGKAYIFNVTTGALVHTLNNPNAAYTASLDRFGTTVAISGNYAIVGAHAEVDASDIVASGKAYIFNVTTGALVHTLNNPNAYGTRPYDRFGWSVAISDNYAIVGATDEDDAAGGLASGKAYIYQLS